MPEFVSRAVLKPKGNRYEDFEIGRRFDHHWGRTINHGDNSFFTTVTLHFNPLYTNAEFARAHGHPDVVVNPMNLDALAVMFARLASATAEGENRREGALHSLYRDGAGRPWLETWLVPGMGHAWSGGDLRATHTYPLGPSATERMLDFLLE